MNVRRLMKSIPSCLVVLFLALCLIHLAGARINTTKSIPIGLYWATCAKPSKGSYVMFCPPPERAAFDVAKDRGYITAGPCPGGYGYMMKRILAVKGDAVRSCEQGVFINGALLALSKPLSSDLSGRALPQYRTDNHTLAADEVLLMSDVSATSFDGRYFGPVPVAQIRSVIKPVFIW